MAGIESSDQEAKVRSHHGEEDDYIDRHTLPRFPPGVCDLSQLCPLAPLRRQARLLVPSQTVP